MSQVSPKLRFPDSNIYRLYICLTSVPDIPPNIFLVIPNPTLFSYKVSLIMNQINVTSLNSFAWG